MADGRKVWYNKCGRGVFSGQHTGRGRKSRAADMPFPSGQYDRQQDEETERI